MSQYAPMGIEGQAAAMRRMGISDEAIARWKATQEPPASVQIQTAPPPFPFPLHITLPWSALCSDNRRKRPTLTRDSIGQVHPRMILTPEYKAASERIRAIARAVMIVDGYTFAPLAQPLELVARVFVPSGRRADVVNFAKGVHDALSKIVFADDLWLYRATWERAGVDVDAPRAELSITPVSAPGSQTGDVNVRCQRD